MVATGRGHGKLELTWATDGRSTKAEARFTGTTKACGSAKEKIGVGSAKGKYKEGRSKAVRGQIQGVDFKWQMFR